MRCDLIESVVGYRSPIPGETVYTDGCRSELTGGVIGSEACRSYHKRTADPADPGEKDPEKDPIDVCNHLCLDLALGLPFGCSPGDSGSGVFARGHNGLDFVGLLVSLYEEDDGMNRLEPFRCGLVVPADRVFAQMRKETGREWELEAET